MTDPLKILTKAFPGQRTPIPKAAEWMDVDQSTIYRWVKHPHKIPRQTQLLFAYLDQHGPIHP